MKRITQFLLGVAAGAGAALLTTDSRVRRRLRGLGGLFARLRPSKGADADRPADGAPEAGDTR